MEGLHTSNGYNTAYGVAPGLHRVGGQVFLVEVHHVKRRRRYLALATRRFDVEQVLHRVTQHPVHGNRVCIPRRQIQNTHRQYHLNPRHLNSFYSLLVFNR